MRTIRKQFGKKKPDDNILIRATSWDGRAKINVLTPKKPTRKQIEETEYFLHQEDDFKAWNEYATYLKKNKIKPVLWK